MGLQSSKQRKEAEKHMDLVFSISNGHLSENQVPVLHELVCKKFPGVTFLQNEWTYLHLASWYGHSFVVSEILQQGADVSSLDNHNETALHLATYNQHLEVVEILLKSGADPNLPNIYGVSSKELAESTKDSKLILLLSQYSTSNPSDLRNANNLSHELNIKIIINDSKSEATSNGGVSRITPSLRETNLS